MEFLVVFEQITEPILGMAGYGSIEAALVLVSLCLLAEVTFP